MERQHIILSSNLEKSLTDAITSQKADKLFVLTDETTQKLCLPLIKDFPCMSGASPIVIKAGDEN